MRSFLLELKWESNPKRAQSGEKVLNVPLRPLWCRFVNEQRAAATFANVTNQTARAVENSAFPLPDPINKKSTSLEVLFVNLITTNSS